MSAAVTARILRAVTARRPLLAIVLLATALFAACGKDGDDPAMSGDPVEEETTTTTAAGADEE